MRRGGATAGVGGAMAGAGGATAGASGAMRRGDGAAVRADLHIHSTVSDGSLTMEEIADRSIEKGMDVIAITDHDTVSHFYHLPVRDGLQVIPGIEISAYDKGLRCKVHILGYCIKDPEGLDQQVEPIRMDRHKNCLRQISILERAGYSLPLEELRKAEGIYIYKQHIMEYLCRTGQVPEMFGEFYQRVFKHGGICDFDIAYMDAVSAVQNIKRAGGLAVLAHSGQQQNFELIPVLERVLKFIPAICTPHFAVYLAQIHLT